MKKIILSFTALLLCSLLIGCSQTENVAETTNIADTEIATEAIETVAEADAAEDAVDENSDVEIINVTIQLLSATAISTEQTDLITSTRAKYDALSEEQKALVVGIEDFEFIEETLAFLKQFEASGFKNLLRITEFFVERKSSHCDEVEVNLTVKNNTEKTIASIRFAVEAFDANGNLVKSGKDESVGFMLNEKLRHYLYSKDYYSSYYYTPDDDDASGGYYAYFGTEAVTYKICYLDITYKNGMHISLTPEQIQQVIY